MMRSIVNKKSGQNNNQEGHQQGAHNQVAFPDIMSVTGPLGSGGHFPMNNMLQGFGLNSSNIGQFTAGMGTLGSLIPPLFPQQARQVTHPGALNQGAGGGNNNDSLMNSNGMAGLGGPHHPSLFPMPNQFVGPQGTHQMGGMTSTDMLEASLCLGRMEQRQQQQMLINMLNHNGGGGGGGNNNATASSADQRQQQQQMMINMLNNNGGGGGGSINNATASTSADASSPFNPPSMQGPPSGVMGNPMAGVNMNSSHGNNHGDSNNSVGTGDMSQVELASQLMKRDPSMDPLKALELAKRLKNHNQ